MILANERVHSAILDKEEIEIYQIEPGAHPRLLSWRDGRIYRLNRIDTALAKQALRQQR